MALQKWSDDIWIVSLTDGPDLYDELTTAAEQAADAQPTPHLVIDFSSVHHVNSSNLSQLLRLRKIAIDHDRKIALAAMTDKVWAIFLTTGLDKVFEFTSDVPTGLAMMQIDETD